MVREQIFMLHAILLYTLLYTTCWTSYSIVNVHYYIIDYGIAMLSIMTLLHLCETRDFGMFACLRARVCERRFLHAY